MIKIINSFSEYSLPNLSSNTQEILRDLEIKVINLARSPERWKNVTSTLNPLEINYKRFNAVDGYKVLLVDEADHKAFTGADLKNQTAHLKLSHQYEIVCNPGNLNPYKFNFTYMDERSFSPGLFGIYCSNFLIYQEIIENNYPYALILEDDIRINPKDFLLNLALYIKNIPTNFDLGYVGVYRDNDHVIKINSHVNQFAPDNGWFTRMAVLVSNKGAQKFLDYPSFFYSFDNFIQDSTKEGIFDVYVATDSLRLLVSIEDNKQSDINSML